jgi:hypothetical protein
LEVLDHPTGLIDNDNAVFFGGLIHGAECLVSLPLLGLIHGLSLSRVAFSALCPAFRRSDIMDFFQAPFY